MKLEEVTLSKNLLKTIFLETLRGKSLGRILINYTFSQVELSGNVLDLGSGSDSPSYKPFMRYKEPFSITYSDYHRGGKNLVKINLKETFDIEKESFDYIVYLGVLEHIYDYRAFHQRSPFMHH